MAVPPYKLQNPIGYVMNRLGHGESVETIRARLEMHSEYGMLSDTDRQAAIYFALNNFMARKRLEIGGGETKIGDTLLKIVHPDDVVGVRVTAVVEGPDGVERDASLTINAPASMTVAEILALATAQINSGQYRPHTGHDCPGFVVGIPIVVGIYEGGLLNPNLNLAY